MTWAEIKDAVEEAGIEETDEILVIKCENLGGDKTLHKARIGRGLRLTEHATDDDRDARGCAA